MRGEMMHELGPTLADTEGAELFTTGPSAAIGAALDRAIEIAESELPARMGREYDWKRDALFLVTSNAFTVRQAALLVQRSPRHVTPAIREELGIDPRKPGDARAMFGVAGKLNPETLPVIRTMRTRLALNDVLDRTVKAHLTSVVDAGTGVGVTAHLLGISAPRLRRALQYYRETREV